MPFRRRSFKRRPFRRFKPRNGLRFIQENGTKWEWSNVAFSMPSLQTGDETQLVAAMIAGPRQWGDLGGGGGSSVTWALAQATRGMQLAGYLFDTMVSLASNTAQPVSSYAIIQEIVATDRLSSVGAPAAMGSAPFEDPQFPITVLPVGTNEANDFPTRVHFRRAQAFPLNSGATGSVNFDRWQNKTNGGTRKIRFAARALGDDYGLWHGFHLQSIDGSEVQINVVDILVRGTLWWRSRF